MVNHFHKVMEKLNASNPKCMSELLTEYEDLMEWINKEDEDIKYNPMTDAKDIEDIALEFTKQHLNPTRKNMSISNKEIAFHAMLIDSDSDSDVIFPEAGNDPDLNTIFLPKSLLKGQETYIVNVVYKNNKTISKLTPTVMEGQDDNKNWSVNTGIFLMTIFPKRQEPFQNVIITLHHIQKMNYSNPHCSFWNFSIPTSYNGSWSQKGCEMVSSTNTHTVCACNHLTNFAVLMKLNSQEVSSEHKEALLIITYAGLALSLLGEAITVLLYCLFLNLRHEKIQIRVNFLCALATAQIIFLAGIDKIENKDLCTFIASLIHLFYLVCFCWMLMEGVFLYRMVVKVFDVHVKMRYAYVFAFGLPSGIVAITLVAASLQSEGIHSYISKRYCWIRFDNDFIWSFVTPVLMLIAINCFFLYRVLKEMVLMKSVKNIKSLELSSIRASARACVLLLPLLGITWLFGLLSVINTSSVNVAWQYIFTILNTMQGFMIFVFHCLRNTELQAAIKLRYFQWESTHSSTHSNRKSSTPAKFLNFDESGSRSNSLPMAAKVNQVRPEKLDMKYRDEGGAHAQYS
ncbi:adhesion G protein-coupled receptor L1-like [Actinia tenebrosa]|uniref:Adhesion G protein-coupled receptor L1-like n=1 Tax=Actinia tenebrosa TaxID=6105 RepID=A0A6P8HQE2_ACTTE|nr:adhesion G protein-coupled receptor L1-like [Actinia tenebrosa]